MVIYLENFKKMSLALAIVCMTNTHVIKAGGEEEKANSTLENLEDFAEGIKDFTENAVEKIEDKAESLLEGITKEDSFLGNSKEKLGAALGTVGTFLATQKDKIASFHAENKFMKATKDKIGCPYKDHPVLVGVVIGAITGVAFYKFINNRINKKALRNLSNEEKQDIALAGLISHRDQLKKEISDIKTAKEKRGFATLDEEKELERLIKENAVNEGYIIAVIRAKKSVADLVTLLFSFDA
jgi:hypothetical protein